MITNLSVRNEVCGFSLLISMKIYPLIIYIIYMYMSSKKEMKWFVFCGIQNCGTAWLFIFLCKLKFENLVWHVQAHIIQKMFISIFKPYLHINLINHGNRKIYLP